MTLCDEGTVFNTATNNCIQPTMTKCEYPGDISDTCIKCKPDEPYIDYLQTSTGFLIVVVIPVFLFFLFHVIQFFHVLFEYQNVKNRIKYEQERGRTEDLIEDAKRRQEQEQARQREALEAEIREKLRAEIMASMAADATGKEAPEGEK